MAGSKTKVKRGFLAIKNNFYSDFCRLKISSYHHVNKNALKNPLYIGESGFYRGVYYFSYFGSKT